MQTLAEDETSSEQSNSRPGSTPTTPFEPPIASTNSVNSNSFGIVQTSTSNSGLMYEAPSLSKEASAQEVTMSRPHNNSYDWAVFISAYASGRWDPHRTPNPPSGPNSGSNNVLSSSRLLGEASLELAIAVNSRRSAHGLDDNGDINDSEHSRSSTVSTSSISTSENVSPIPARVRQPSEGSNPYPRPPTHRLRNSFSAAPSAGGRKPASLPLGPSLSTGAPAEQANSPQKAKAGLFLNLPSLLSVKASSGMTPGIDTSPSTPSPYNVALQSNALHSNSSYSYSGDIDSK